MAKKESSTKSFVLRVDAETMDAIEKWAADEFRSTNGQLQWMIAEALRKNGRLKKLKNLKTETTQEEISDE
ncbi:MAG: Arc family DNA-binding protein [Bacteroides sp.]